MRRHGLLALLLIVALALPVDAARGNIFSTRAIRVLSSLLDASGNLTIQGGAVKALTESNATDFARLAVPSLGTCAARVVYTVFAADATNAQTKSGQVFVSVVANSAGAISAATPSDVNTLNPVSSGTLTNTMGHTTAVANAYTVSANALSSLTQTKLEIRYRVETLGGTCTVTGL